MRFVDTNILLYRISSDPLESHKQIVAAEILSQRDLSLSVQVLQEFYVQSTRPSRPDPLSHADACALIRSWKRYPVLGLDVALVERAFSAKERWQLSYWDAAILEAARSCECEVLLSEDLNHGQDYDGVRVVNPFL
ncbi:PIN domain-containing protein [Coraliomargarita sinensis]|nr:PIN domain-containing protein [Coraliomargarita sinensis]